MALLPNLLAPAFPPLWNVVNRKKHEFTAEFGRPPNELHLSTTTYMGLVDTQPYNKYGNKTYSGAFEIMGMKPIFNEDYDDPRVHWSKETDEQNLLESTKTAAGLSNWKHK